MATLDEILAYVAETPGNTNPAVLTTLIGEGGGGGGDLPEGVIPAIIVTFSIDEDTGAVSYSPTWAELEVLWPELGNDATWLGVYDGSDPVSVSFSDDHTDNSFYFKIATGDGPIHQFKIDYTTHEASYTAIWPSVWYYIQNTSSASVTIATNTGSETVAASDWSQTAHSIIYNNNLNAYITFTSSSDISGCDLSLDNASTLTVTKYVQDSNHLCMVISGTLPADFEGEFEGGFGESVN